MKILQVCLETSMNGGHDKVAEADRRLLKKNGHRVTTFEKNAREMNKYSLVKNSHFGGNSCQGNEYSSQVRALIQKHRPNIVHIYNTISANLSDLYDTCQRMGIGVIQSLQCYEFLCPMSVQFYSGKVCRSCVQKSLLEEDGQKKCFRDNQIQDAELTKMIRDYWNQKVSRERIDYYLVPTEFFRQKLISYGLPMDRVIVKPVFSDEPLCDPDERGNYVLFIGKLTEESGIRVLLRAFDLLRDVPLRILGDGPLKQEVLDACTNNSNLEFLGWQPKADCLKHLANALLVAFPTEGYDPFPSIIIKSYAHGVPVVSSDLGGMEHIVLDGVSGYLFPHGNFQMLAEKIDTCLKNQDIITSMGAKARAEYEEKYTSEKNYQILINTYQDSLSRKRRDVDRGNKFRRPMPSRHCLVRS